VYCLSLARSRWVDVTSTSVDEAQHAAAVAYPEGKAPDAPCGSGTTARVTIDAPGSPGLDDGPFLFVSRKASDAS
jgi:proline racemase